MSINRRQANLLKTLVSTTSYLPTATLAGELSCSERTVRNDVAAINAFLEQNGLAARTASKRGTGIQLNPSPAERERILGLVKERALALDPALDRFYRGILLLICDYNGDYTVESLARAILTNKQQAQEDIRAWNDMLYPYGARIERGHRLTVVGPEEHIRFFVTHSLFELAPTAMKRRVEPQLFGEDRQFLFDEIEAVERTLDCPFTDNARHELAIYLQVMTLRIRKGKSVPARATAIPPAFAAMLGRIEKHYGITLGSGEKAVVIELFSVAARRWTPDFQDTYTPDRESAHLADDLFRALADRYGARPASHLRKPLAMLFEAGITHRKLDRAIALPPEISWTVRFENMTLFMRLAQLMRDTPSLSSVDLYETDLTRIAMLLLDFMDGIAVSDTWRAGLVVNCGVEQVLFARDRIERFLPFIRIARVIPESEEAGGSTALDGLDFLISFDPIETALPVAVISSAITELDRRHINDTILTIAQHRAQGDRPVDDDLPARELPQMEGESLRDALRRALTKENLWAGTVEEFHKIFEMCSFTCGSTLILTYFSHEAGRTGSTLFSIDAQIPFRRTRLTHAAVLAVSTSDERALGALSQTFRRKLATAGLAPAEL